MKSYTGTERIKHVENWKNGTLSKAAYAKSVGIQPTTFYTWIRLNCEKNPPGFAEINRSIFAESTKDITIEKGGITIRMPLSVSTRELQNIFEALKDKA